jgi:hypothetical protein
MKRLFVAACLSTVSLLSVATADEPGFVPLFDGKTTEGWSPVGGQPGNWVVRDGLLITKGQGGGWISTNKTYDNFVLTLEFRLGPGGNSGVFIRSPRTGDPAYTGMEIQVLDDDDKQYKDLQPFQYTGSVYGVVAAKRGHTKRPGEWNVMVVRAEGSKVTVQLNGTTIVDTDLNEHKDAAEKHPGILRKEGYIGLQSHSDEVQFRNIAVKGLK